MKFFKPDDLLMADQPVLFLVTVECRLGSEGVFAPEGLYTLTTVLTDGRPTGTFSGDCRMLTRVGRSLCSSGAIH